jgi:DNA-binding NarL/FixJ family response regulator
MKTSKIFIVDDHQIVRRGLTNFINSMKGFTVCGEAENANAAIAKINTSNPDIVIVDIGLREISGIELIKSIRARYKHIKVLVLTMHGEVEYVERAINAGALGYVLKSEREDQIIDALKVITTGKKYISNSLKDMLVEKLLWNDTNRGVNAIDTLTEREKEIFDLIGRGFNTRRISEKLGLGISTVGTYRERLKKKLKIEEGSELVRFAVKNSMAPREQDE